MTYSTRLLAYYKIWPPNPCQVLVRIHGCSQVLCEEVQNTHTQPVLRDTASAPTCSSTPWFVSSLVLIPGLYSHRLLSSSVPCSPAYLSIQLSSQTSQNVPATATRPPSYLSLVPSLFFARVRKIAWVASTEKSRSQAPPSFHSLQWSTLGRTKMESETEKHSSSSRFNKENYSTCSRLQYYNSINF